MTVRYFSKKSILFFVICFTGLWFCISVHAQVKMVPRPPVRAGDSAKPAARNPQDSIFRSYLINADKLYILKFYDQAMQEINKAAALRPGDLGVRERTNRIRAAQAKVKSTEEDYQKTIRLADDYFAAKDYLNAKASYQLAIDLRPDDNYPRQQLSKVMDVIRSQKAQNTLYDVAIANADQLFQSKEYDKAKAEYESASRLLPGEKYPLDKINEIIRIQVDEQMKDEQYAKAILNGDLFYNQKVYASALPEYKKATTLKPEEQYPKDRIAELTVLLKKQKEIDDAYQKLIASADQFFTSRAYPDAKKSYQDALKLKPDQEYPKSRIKEIETLLARRATTDQDYQQTVDLADSLYISKDYARARSNYLLASSIKPGEAYPKEMASKAESMMSGQEAAMARALQEQYTSLIASGDKLLGDKSYEAARSEYVKAGGLKPAEKYPKDKIAEIDNILSTRKQADEDAYKSVLANADQLFGEKSYDQAKSGYQKASGMKPQDDYPKKQIAQIESILAGMAAKEKAANDQYAALIASGDKFMAASNYAQAKGSFEQALKIKPDEAYPKTKLDEITKLLADQAIQKEMDDRYKGILAGADKLMQAKTYDQARTEYQNASALKPQETYPKTKIAEIDNILAGLASQKQKDEQYKLLVAQGDSLFTLKSWEPSRSAYQQALALKPGEAWPKSRIAEIEKTLAGIAQANVLESRYQSFIRSGDSLLGLKSYETAKASYGKALALKSQEAYPKSKIAEIDLVLADLAKQKSLEDQYASSIAAADKLLAAKNYDPAKAEYTKASGLKPTEQYPKDKIAEIDAALSTIAEQKAKDDQYRSILADADKQLLAKSYDEAKISYQKALTVKPEEAYPKAKIAEIDKALADIAAKKSLDEQYTQAISEGDKLLATKSYDASKSEYQKASVLKPGEAYPKTKITEIDKALAEIARTNALEARYQTLIRSSDSLLGLKSYEKSKAGYGQALALKPQETYPKSKIAEIDLALADIAKQKALDEQYNTVIASADKLLAAKTYDQAKAEYTKASGLKPGEQYPKDKIAEIDAALAALADQKAKDEQYRGLIAGADKQLLAKSYDEAKTSYQKALAIKPGEAYPTAKIAEIDKTLADIAAKKSLDEQYARAISEGDKLLAAKSYDEAKTQYQKASGLKPEEAYPKTRITEIDKALAEIARLKELDAHYTQAIANGDKLLGEKSYEGSKTEFQKAAGLKPAEQYPKTKLAEIDKLLADIAKQKALDDQYSSVIAGADKLLAAKTYDQAKAEYTKASGLKPAEQYPKDKIAEIDATLAAIADQRAKDLLYKNILADGDKLLLAKSYDDAKNSYRKALDMRPAEEYPKSKIAEIDKILADIAAKKALDDQFAQSVANADKLFAAKSYEESKAEYQKASGLKPDEAYPKTKIAEIDGILTEIAKKKELENQYSQAIANGDKLFGDKSYELSKAEYQKATGLKPTEQYPRTKIAEIDKLLGDLARQKALDDQYNGVIAGADKLLADKSYDLAKAEYQKASVLKPQESYPKQKMAEIASTIADIAAQKTRDDQYKRVLANADKLLSGKSYDLAKAEYKEALGVKPDEQYPKDKIAEIETILAEIKAKDEAYHASVAKADQLFTEKKYDEAHLEYQNATSIKPTEVYPKNKMEEINRIQTELKGKQKTYDDLIAGGDRFFSTKEYDKSKDNFQQASRIFPDQSYPKDRVTRINSMVDSIYRTNKAAYDQAVAEGDRNFNTLIFDKAIDSYTEAMNLLPMENYPREMINKITRIIAENAIVDVVKSSEIIKEGGARQFTFTPVEIASRKNNYFYIKIRNLSNKPFNVLVRYGKDKQTNGGAVIKNLAANGVIAERLVNIGDQDPWYREDNNWISFLPQGGDIEVTFLQISKSK